MRTKQTDKIKLSDDQRKRAIHDIKCFFNSEREENIGDLASDIMLDFITEKLGPYYYNQGVADTQKYLIEKIEDIYGLYKLE